MKIVELQIPEGTGSLAVARGSLRFDSDDPALGRGSSFAAKATYTKDTAVIEKNPDWDAQAKADVAVSTRKVEGALKALDEGREDDASRELKEARAYILNSPAASQSGAVGQAIQEQGEKLERYSDTLKENKDDTKKAKKSIQYDNYRTQKNK